MLCRHCESWQAVRLSTRKGTAPAEWMSPQLSGSMAKFPEHGLFGSGCCLSSHTEEWSPKGECLQFYALQTGTPLLYSSWLEC